MRRYLLLAAVVALMAEPLPAAGGGVLSRKDVEQAVAGVEGAFTHATLKVPNAVRRPGRPLDWLSFELEITHARAVQISASDLHIVWNEPGHATAHLSLQATETQFGGATVPFPAHWTIEVEDDGGQVVVTAVLTDEALLAGEMLPPQSDEQRRCLIESRPDLDWKRVIDALGDDLATPVIAALYDDAFVFALQWTRAHHDRDTEVHAIWLGSVRAVFRNDAALAIAMAEATLDRAGTAASPYAAVRGWFSLGIGEWRAGLTHRALKHLRHAADLFHSLEDPISALKSEYMYAYILESRGDLRLALESAERLRTLSHELQWEEGERDADWMFADVQLQLNNLAVSREYHRRILRSCERAGDNSCAAMALADLGVDEMYLGHSRAARDLLSTSLRRTGGDYHAISLSASLSHVLAQLGDFEGANKVLDDADRVGTPDESIRSETALARAELAYAQKHFGDAERFAKQAIAMASMPTRISAFVAAWPAQTMLARSLFALGRLDEAETAFRDAIASVEAQFGDVAVDDMGRVRVYEKAVAPYRGLAELLAARGRTHDALTVAERIRARALREMIEQGKIDLDAALTGDERNQKQELEHRVTERTRASLRADAAPVARRELDQARLELEDFNARIAAEHGRAFSGAVVRRDDVLSPGTIGPDEIAVEYLAGERQTLAFLITRHGVAVRKLPISAPHLGVLVRRLSKSLQQRDLGWERASRAVYDAVIRPIAPSLASFSHICVIPDGDLWSVPFDVLLDGRGVALIEKATISYAPSLLMLRDTRRRQPRSDSRLLFALANPTIDAGTTARVRSVERDARLGALPEAEREVKSLRDLYGSARSDVYVGAAARESLFKAEASRYRVLHIATHGMVDDRSPMYSCLVLAPDAQDDGLLEMREIVGLDLHAELAVLSSCETARGRIAPGEGLVGIAWAFLAAGCPTTVVSQWKVDSAATERLMVDFHRQLIRTHFTGKAEALRKAKLALKKQPRYAHPFYWAPFIVVGNR